MFPGYLIPIHELHQAHSSSEIFSENPEHALPVLHAASTQVEQQCDIHSFMMHQSQATFIPILNLPPPPQVFYERDRVLSRVSSRSSFSARAGSSSEDNQFSLQRPKKGNSEDEVRTLYITGLPHDVKHREIKNLFQHIPEFEGAVIKSSHGHVNPIAFATFSTVEAASSAKLEYSGYQMESDNADLKLKIDFAKSNTKNRGHLYPRFDHERVLPALEMTPALPCGTPVYPGHLPPPVLQPVFTSHISNVERGVQISQLEKIFSCFPGITIATRYPFTNKADCVCIQSHDPFALQFVADTINGKTVVDNFEIGVAPGLKVHEAKWN